MTRFLCPFYRSKPSLLMTVLALFRQPYSRFSPGELTQIALLFAVLEPFLLPRMHERYFYTADVLAVIYAFLCPRRWLVPIFVGAASLSSYLPFAFGIQPVKLSYAAAFTGSALTLLVRETIRGARRWPACEVKMENTQR